MLMTVELINCFHVNESYLVIQQVTEHELFPSQFLELLLKSIKNPINQLQF